MTKSYGFFETTVGRKILMGATGLFLCFFLIIHLSGNLALFAKDGGEAFNLYTRFMTSNFIIRVLEIGLVLGFLIHIIVAVRLTVKNNAARPVKYHTNRVEDTSSWSSRNMGLTGSVILAFLVLHLQSFWFRYKFGETPMDQWGNKDMYAIVMASFNELWYSAAYLVSMVILFAHLNHGFQSAFRSTGLNNRKYAPILQRTGTIFAIIMGIGYSAFPIIFYFNLFGYNN